MSKIYTDLAMESRELNPNIKGVEECCEEHDDIRVTRTQIISNEAMELLQKPKGSYVSIEAPIIRSSVQFEMLSGEISKEIEALIAKANIAKDGSILVIGLGNRAITPDALGPKCIDGLFVTRHIKQYMPDAISKPIRSVCAVTPGVLGVTGVETLEIIKGVSERVEPKLIIAIDALAARRSSRIGNTVQMTNTGINPGAGIGNNRAGISSQALGVPVIAIGVPLVVYAGTIISDCIDEKNEVKIPEEIEQLIVTPKEIDAMVDYMSKLISDALNHALHNEYYEELKSLIA